MKDRARLLRRVCGIFLLSVLALPLTGSGSDYIPSLWVAATHALARFSANDGAVLDEIDRTGPPPDAFAESALDGEVWALFHRELDAWTADGNSVVSVDLPGDVHINDSHVALAVATSGGVLWLAGHKALYRFDLSGNLLSSVSLDHNPDAISIDPYTSRLWSATNVVVTAYDAAGNVTTSFSLDGSEDVRRLVWSQALDSLWVLRDGELERYGPDGTHQMSVDLDSDLDQALARAGDATAWVAGDHELARVDSSGLEEFELDPFQGGSENVIALAADPADQSVWVAGKHKLVHVDADGTVLQTVNLDHSHGSIRAAALYAALVPPTLTFVAPSAGAYVDTRTPPLEFHYGDYGPGVDLLTVALTANGASVATSCTASDGSTPTAGTADCALVAALDEGGQSLSATVRDFAGNESNPVTLAFTVDTVSPSITLTSPSGQYTNQPEISVTGSVSEAGALAVDGSTVTIGPDLGFATTVDLNEGDNTLMLIATDLAGNTAMLTQTVTLDTVAPEAPNLGLVSVSDPVNGELSITGLAGAVDPGVSVTVTDVTTGTSVTVYADQNGGFTATLPGAHGDLIAITLTDEAGNIIQGDHDLAAGTLPPAPASVAPPLTHTGITPFANATSFLYSGANPIQTGVATGAITVERAAVIRGRVLDPNGHPLPGTTVAILHRPEFGGTQSRVDGRFDLAVNGGGSLTVVYQRKGYTEVERTVPVVWNDYAWAPDVVLRPLAADAGTVSFGVSASAQYVAGPTTDDDSGSRQPAVFFPANTTATMQFPDGSSASLATGSLRITEYTVGQRGPEAMPAKLPTYSAYTYAADFRFDEATAQSASSVQFSQAVYIYLTNFLQVPIGATVPSGAYDFDQAEWMASPNGLVIKILGVNDQGEAEVDVDGSGQLADSYALTQLGFTNVELTQLATHYPVGSELWRIPAEHFSPYDWNWWGIEKIAGVMSNAGPHRPQLPPCQPGSTCCEVSGCIVRAVEGGLGERLPAVGTPYSLYYSSERTVGGRSSSRTLVIPLTSDYDPSAFPDLKGVHVEVDVVGEHFMKDFPPGPNQTYTYTWDGLDGYDRPVTGSVKAHVTVSVLSDIRYVAIHDPDTAWDRPLWDGTLEFAMRSDVTETVAKRFPSITLDSDPPPTAIANGWGLNVHATYDEASGTLYQGDGTQRSVSELPLQPNEVASNLVPNAPLQPYPSGSVMTLTSSSIVSVGPDGTQTTIADIPDDVQIVDVGNIGFTFYALDAANGQIDAVTEGSLTPVVTGLVQPRAFAPDSGGGFLVATCGAIFSAQFYVAPVRVAGQGCEAAGDSGDSGPALHGKIDPSAIGVGSDGSVYFIQRSEVDSTPADRVRKIAPDGTLSTVVGGGETDATGIQAPVAATSVAFARLNDLLVRSDGGLLLADVSHYYAEDGSTLQPPNSLSQGMSAGHVTLLFSGDFAVSTSDGELWMLAPALPTTAANSYLVADSNGRAVSAFDAYGRETGIYDTITGTQLISFQYDDTGRLVGVTNAFGRSTMIERNGNGHATAIVSPDGQTTSLTVNGNGDLKNLADPAGDVWQMTYDSGSLLARFTSPDGHEDQYGYDLLGRLISVQEPNGGGWLITAPNLATAPSDSYAITLASGEGRTTTYHNDAGKWYCLYPGWRWSCGWTSSSVQHPDGTESLSGKLYGMGWSGEPATTFATHPDGTYTLASDYPDPRFGYQSPLHNFSLTTPSNATTSFTEIRTAVLQPGNPLAVSSYTEKTVEGASAPFVNHFDAATSTWTTTTPVGRTVTTTVDVFDRPVTVKAPALATVAYAYDDAGRLSGVTVGSGVIARVVGFQYYLSGPAKGYLQSVTDPLGRITGFGYDPAGRVTSETLSDGEIIGFGYDAVGNLVSVSPPARPAHDFSYDAVNDLASYAPPAASGGSGVVGYSYNLDRQLTGISLPSGANVALRYNNGAQLAALLIPTGQFDYGYDTTTGQLTSISGGADDEGLAFQYDGFLPTQSAWAGAVPGTVSAVYDQLFRVASIKVDGQPVDYSYEGVVNADGLLTRAGTLNLTRNAGNGLVTKAVLAATAGSAQTVSSVYSYDDFGELAITQMISAPEQVDLLIDVNPPTATAPNLNVAGTLPDAAELQICVNDVTPCSLFPVDGDGSVTGSVALTQNNNSLAIAAFDATGNPIGQGESSVAYQPAAAAYTVNSLEAVGPDGTLYFAGSSTAEQGTQFVLAPGAASATVPAALQPANQNGLTVASNSEVYYLDGNDVLWHWTSGGTLTSLVDLSAAGYYPSSLAAGSDDYVYFTQFDLDSLYRIDPSGDVSTAGTLGDCSNQALAPADGTGGKEGIGPNIIAFGYDLTTAASANGIFVGCEDTDQTTYVVHKLQADGSFTVQATSTLSQPEFAAGPDGTICFAEDGDSTIVCVAPDGSETDSSLVNGVYGFGLDGAGNLYYAADDADGNSMLWHWMADGSAALLPPSQPEPATLTVSGTVVTPPGATYDRQYTRNPAGEVTTITETINGASESWSYGYDANGRLESVVEDGSVTTYGYDANGNRVSVDGATVATYNAQDQLLTYGSNSYDWTFNGELASKTTPSDTTDYTWNALGELTDVENSDGTAIHYIYDGVGRRVGKETIGTLVAGYLYAGSQLIAETDGSGEITERYVYATKPNVPDYLIKYNDDGTTSAYRIVSDQAGSVRLVIDASSGAIVQQIGYDVWGNIESDTNPGFQPFAFAGGLFDADTGLVHFGARDYDPVTGRWISRDPILFAGGDPNLYRYVVDDPVNIVDPYGENAAIQDLNDAREGQGLPPLKPPSLPTYWHFGLGLGAQGLLVDLGIGLGGGVEIDSAGHLCFSGSRSELVGIGFFGGAGISASAGIGLLCSGTSGAFGVTGMAGEVGGTLEFGLKNGNPSFSRGLGGLNVGGGAGGAFIGTKTFTICFKL